MHIIYHDERRAYQPLLSWMESAQRERRDGEIPDTAVYVEHEPVITYGRSTPKEDLQARPHGIETVEIPRGGLATWHGPGQLVGYYILDLQDRGGLGPDIHAFLRALEEGLIRFVEGEYGLSCGRREGFTGVWTNGFPVGGRVMPGPGRKLASIGVSARRWITAHGFALNIHPDMGAFDSIVPCGITDAEMTSIEREFRLAGKEYTPKPIPQVARLAHPYLLKALQDSGWCGGVVRELIEDGKH